MRPIAEVSYNIKPTEGTMVATAGVSVLPRVRIALSAMDAARKLRTRDFDIAKHKLICLVQDQVDRVIHLLSQRISDHEAIEGSLWEGLHEMYKGALKGRGIVLLSHLSHPDYRKGSYAIGRTMNKEWFVLDCTSNGAGGFDTRCRINDSTVMLMVVPGNFAAIKEFADACHQTVADIFQKRIDKLEKARDACALGWIAEAFDQSSWEQAQNHIANLRSRR